MIVVCMLVKNEAETIAQTLESVRSVLGDKLREIVIHDTGSTDATVDRCERHGAVVYGRGWYDDFGRSRTELLTHAEAYAGPGDLILMLDAGTILRGELKIPKAMKANCGWNVRIKLGSIEYPRPQLFRPHVGWRYEGRVHEGVIAPEDAGLPKTDCGLIVDYCLKDAARPERWKRDVEILQDDYSPRGRFYYAQSLELTGDPARAFFWYLHRAERTDGWWEERCQAYIRAIKLAPSVALARWCCDQALEIDGRRGEAPLQFALYASTCATTPDEWREVQMRAVRALMCVPLADALFVDTDRAWLARELIARAFFWLGDKPCARGLWTALLADAPEYMHAQIKENLRFCDGS